MLSLLIVMVPGSRMILTRYETSGVSMMTFLASSTVPLKVNFPSVTTALSNGVSGSLYRSCMYTILPFNSVPSTVPLMVN